ncbi:MAG: hypothetical protein R6U54_04985, partial [Candidatus Omnitrophota bacterium]
MIRSLNKFIKVVLIFTFFVFFNFLLIQNNINTIFAQSTEADAEEGNIEVLKFKDANIKTVIRSIAQKAYRDGKKVNIVTSPDVEGAVTVNLEDLDWLTAL